jgi:hypothetical protein
MAGKVGLTFKDYAGQTSRFELATDDITAGNLVAQTALMDALITAVGGLTRGRITRETMLAIDTDNGNASSSDPEASRELKWLLRLSDSVTGETLFRELPTAELTGNLAANSEEADMAAASWVSLKSAIDGNFNNPETGNSLILVSAKKVGRNL